MATPQPATQPAPQPVIQGAGVSPEARAHVLADLRTWLLTLTDRDLALLGVDASIEEPLRLISGYARKNGISL